MERVEILREIRELENHISESNLSASSVSASSVYASSNTDEMVAILSEGQLLVPGHINSTKLITVFMRKMTPEEAQVERLRLAAMVYTSTQIGKPIGLRHRGLHARKSLG